MDWNFLLNHIVSVIFIVLYLILVISLVIMLVLDNRNPVKTMAWMVVLFSSFGR